MFISELIGGRFYYIAEKPAANGSPSRLLRWSMVPHKPEPIVRIHYSQVPRYIREQCQKLFDGDCRRHHQPTTKRHPIILEDADHVAKETT